MSQVTCYGGGPRLAGDGSEFDALGKVRQVCDVGGEGVGSGGDALVGLQVQPFLRVGAVKVHYQKKLGILEKEVFGEIVHRVSP